MSTKILLKKSSSQGGVPLTSDLDFGELALNYADGVLYYKKSDGTISSISGSSGGGTGVLTRTEFEATQGQTRFYVSYTIGSGNIPNAFIYLNGVLLLAGDDYTGTNGVYIDLTTAADEGDVVEIFVYAISSVANALQITSNLADLNDPATALSNLNANLANFISTFTLPTSDGTVGQALITNGNGTLSFGTVASSGSELPADALGYLYNDGAGNISWGTFTIPTDVSDLTDTTGIIPSLTGYATETYVDTAVTNLVDSAPLALDTLNELAAALGDDANFSTTVTTSLGLKANSADLATVATSGLYSDLTGTPTIPADVGDLTDTGGLLTHFDGDYNSLTNQPTIPEATSDLTNDSGFITSSIRYESKVISSNTTLDAFTHYFTGVNTVINNGITLTIPADSLLEIKTFAAGKPL